MILPAKELPGWVIPVIKATTALFLLLTALVNHGYGIFPWA